MTEETPPLSIDDFEICEWDRRSPINGVPVPTFIFERLRLSDGTPCPRARVLLIREKTTGVAVFAQHLAVWNCEPLIHDHDLERMRLWLLEHRLPGILYRPDIIAMAAMRAREAAAQHEQRRAALLGTGFSASGALVPVFAKPSGET